MLRDRPRRGFGNAGGGGGMPPVQLLSQLAPVWHPQHFPSSPHRLPPDSERPVKRNTLLFDPALPPLPTSAPIAPGVGGAKTYEPHRYAMLIESLFLAPAAASGQPFLLQATAQRNFLGLRNTQAAGGDDIFIGFGRDASVFSWLVLAPTEIVEFSTTVPQNDLYAISTTGAGQLAYAYATFVPGN